MFFASESWLCQRSKNWLWRWPNLIVKLDILCSYRFGFSHQRFSRIPYSFREVFDWEIFAFDSCIKCLILRKRSGVFFESPWFWKTCFAVSRGSISSIKVSIRSFQLLANHQVPKLSNFFLATETWLSEISGNCCNLRLISMFKLNFSDFTGLICSITVPIDLFGVVTNQSNKK